MDETEKLDAEIEADLLALYQKLRKANTEGFNNLLFVPLAEGASIDTAVKLTVEMMRWYVALRAKSAGAQRRKPNGEYSASSPRRTRPSRDAE